MLANQTEVDDVFHQFGISKINPAKLSYDEQKTMFADAELIIGVFGTELYCLFNMRPGSAVIELIWNAEHATGYGPICSFLEMNHHLIVCESSKQSGNTLRKIDRDLSVDCTELHRRLEALTAQHNK